ncbi:MAG: LytTR family DNA-binding domain-containing protein [Chloroflexota bacterium]|nr:LytTR family DNA-binding domain-containing protein [Chloroflexota bacterium]
MRTLIVDDEAPARERLRRLLLDIEGVELIGEAEDGIQAVEMIERERPDLVLLDVQMPGLDGFGVIEALADPPPVIFVTAYDEYAIRAFEVNALDYLLKPFSRERLERAVRRAQEELAEERNPGMIGAGRFATRLVPLLESLAAQGCYLARLAVRDYESRRIRVLDTDEVDWISVEDEQVMVHVGNRAYPIRRTLTELEARLDPACFFRAHRSAIVNLDRVKEIIPWFKGSHKLRLTTGAEVELSRAQTRALRRLLGW